MHALLACEPTLGIIQMYYFIIFINSNIVKMGYSVLI